MNPKDPHEGFIPPTHREPLSRPALHSSAELRLEDQSLQIAREMEKDWLQVERDREA